MPDKGISAASSVFGSLPMHGILSEAAVRAESRRQNESMHGQRPAHLILSLVYLH